MPKRMIDTDLWNDSKFADEFTPEDKYFWLFLLTTRYGSIAGVFEVSPKQIAKDMGYSEESVSNLIERFIRYELIDYDKDNKELLILNWYRYNWSSSPLVEKSITKELGKIKTERFKEYVIDTYAKTKTNDTLSIGYRYHTNTISNNISITNKELSIKDIKEKENKIKEKEKAENYGEFGRVRLTATEYERAKTKYGDDLETIIADIDIYCETNKKQYKSFLGAMATFVARDGESNKPKYRINNISHKPTINKTSNNDYDYADDIWDELKKI